MLVKISHLPFQNAGGEGFIQLIVEIFRMGGENFFLRMAMGTLLIEL